jgi:hypothetical protein
VAEEAVGFVQVAFLAHVAERSVPSPPLSEDLYAYDKVRHVEATDPRPCSHRLGPPARLARLPAPGRVVNLAHSCGAGSGSNTGEIWARVE